MYKLLVVDDEADVCDFVKHFFEERNYSVTTAYDGEQAVRCVRKGKFDIILLDIKMKKMGGLEALRQIMLIDPAANVIMVTAMEDQASMEEACKLGACKYITKPLILEDLENAVYEKTKSIKPEPNIKEGT